MTVSLPWKHDIFFTMKTWHFLYHKNMTFSLPSNHAVFFTIKTWHFLNSTMFAKEDTRINYYCIIMCKQQTGNIYENKVKFVRVYWSNTWELAFSTKTKTHIGKIAIIAQAIFISMLLDSKVHCRFTTNNQISKVLNNTTQILILPKNKQATITTYTHTYTQQQQKTAKNKITCKLKYIPLA